MEVAAVVRLDEEFAMMKLCKFMCDRNEIGGFCQVATVCWKIDPRLSGKTEQYGMKKLLVW